MIAAVAAGGWLLAGLIVVSAHWLAASRATGVARACHELRGPLFAISLGVELASRGGVLPADRVRGLELELGRARQALDDLARAGGVGAGTAEPAGGCVGEVDLAQLVRESAEAWGDGARERAVRVELPPPAELLVTGERLRLAQALANLIGNAVQHADGDVLVSLRAVPGRALVEVRDDGPGLPVAIASRLARNRRPRRHAWLLKEMRLPARHAAVHGHGLWIASGVAAAHGGRLTSVPAKRGARMVLELPLATRTDSARR
jgi:signal transduction histidine kinase